MVLPHHLPLTTCRLPLASRPVDADVLAGQAVYNRGVLAIYDLTVLRSAVPLLMGCRLRELIGLYERNLGPSHLDIGVGTGYLLDRARFPVPAPQITLVDLNPAPLRVTSHRLRRYRPLPVRANALEPLPLAASSVDSAGLNLLLHCLPGPMHRKASALTHAARVVRPGGRIFGATVLGGGVPRRAAARILMSVYNARGIFHNAEDTLDALRIELSTRFRDHKIHIRGCVALFEATV
jgi:SAM-dependent methyltransferase